MQIIKESKVRTSEEDSSLKEVVSNIINKVSSEGDSALIHYNTTFEKNSRENLLVSKEEIRKAYSELTTEEIENIKSAASNIKHFAEAQKKTLSDLNNIETVKGSTLGHRVIPINSVGCYVPGGTYPLYSSALMLIIPAKVAGCKRIVAISPSMKGKKQINSKTLVAMDIAGADEIYTTGGAHGVAALTYGTEQIKPVDIIVGPGNQYVSEAKRQCYGKVGIDFIAGPSEVLVIADETADPKIIAADILAQSEHDLLAKGILITTSHELALSTINEVEKQLTTLETREIAKQSWADYGEVVLVESLEEAVNLSNVYAPEHLEVFTKNPDELIDKLTNYGSLFISEETGEVFGDYASGTNHTLPTMKAARYTGGVWVGTFLKVCTYQKMTKEGANTLAPLVAKLAEGEGLDGHKKAALVRINSK